MRAKLILFLALPLFVSGCRNLIPAIDNTVEMIPLKKSTMARFANNIESSSNFTRSSAEVMALRLNNLFPGFSTNDIIAGQGLGRFLGQANFVDSYRSSRAAGTLAQSAFRSMAAGLCQSQDVNKNKLFSTDAVLMVGSKESLPTDPIVRLAFSAARNGWLYPYSADSSEVQALVSLYKDVLSAGGPDGEGRQNICMAVLLAPQFWLGNQGKFEPIRRIALDIGLRLPTFVEFDNFNLGRLTIAQYIDAIQKESGYMKSVKSWHREWLGLKNMAKEFPKADPRGWKYHFAHGGASSVAGQNFYLDKLPNGAPYIEVSVQNNAYSFTNGNQCDPALLDQPFDPVTTELYWEQKNPINGAWERIAGWKKNQGAWAAVTGSVTLANGSQMATSIEDVAMTTRNATTGKYEYLSGRLRNSPMQGFAATDMRAVRFSPSGKQNGFSKVKTWWRNDEVYVCNDLNRFLASCFYRPLRESQGGVPAMGGTYPYITPNQPNAFQAIIPEIVLQNWGGEGATIAVNTLAHPVILENFNCGKPTMSSPTEIASFPKTAPWNDLVINGKVYVDSSKFADSKEGAAYQSVLDDVALEPDLLIEDIVSQSLDYRLLLTADYTIGRGPLDLFYRTQGYWLPAYPGYSPLSAGYDNYHKIRSADFLSLPARKWLQSPNDENTTMSITNGPGGLGFISADLSSPRPMSGVLTQNAFLMPGGLKMRSQAARIFRTFTCGDLPSYMPSGSEASLHVNYIPKQEITSGQHLDPKKTCYSCHVNMDPLAAALSSGFLAPIKTADGQVVSSLTALGEIKYFSLGDDPKSATYGFRGNLAQASEGALFGQKIKGVVEAGRVLANRPEFASCAVLRAFEGVFGRAPAFSDRTLLQATADRFRNVHNYNYNKMLKDLLLSPNYEKRD